MPPVDAAGHGTLRKLRGEIQFLQECGQLEARIRLRPPATQVELDRDPGDDHFGRPGHRQHGGFELAALDMGSLGYDQLEEAFQTAQKLDARDVAGKFAAALVERPSRTEKPDRYPWHHHLIQLAVNQGDWDAALDRSTKAKRTTASTTRDAAATTTSCARPGVREAGLDRSSPGRVRQADRAGPERAEVAVSAAEALLSAKQPGHALKIAEAGLAEARQNSRDLEGAFLELAEAARRQAEVV